LKRQAKNTLGGIPMAKTKKSLCVVVAVFQGLVETVYVVNDDDDETQKNLSLDILESGRSVQTFRNRKIWDMEEYNDEKRKKGS